MGPAELKKYIQRQWDMLRTDCVYEIDYFGDLLMQAVSRGTKKKILIFNTNVNITATAGHDPISVVDPRDYGSEINSEIPVVLAYNLVHFESFHPVS